MGHPVLARKQRCTQRPLPLTFTYWRSVSMSSMMTLRMRCDSLSGLGCSSALSYVTPSGSFSCRRRQKCVTCSAPWSKKTHVHYVSMTQPLTTYFYTYAAKCQVHIIRRLKPHTVTLRRHSHVAYIACCLPFSVLACARGN